MFSMLEKLLNGYLSLDHESSSLLEDLENKSISIHMTRPDMAFQLLFSKKKIIISSLPSFDKRDVTLKGPFISFLEMLKNTSTMLPKGIILQGDVEVAQKIQKLFKGMEIPWDHYLALLLGDFLGYHTMKASQGFLKTLQETHSFLSRSVGEFLQEETSILPSPQAISYLWKELIEVRNGVERMETKLKEYGKDFSLTKEGIF